MAELRVYTGRSWATSDRRTREVGTFGRTTPSAGLRKQIGAGPMRPCQVVTAPAPISSPRNVDRRETKFDPEEIVRYFFLSLKKLYL